MAESSSVENVPEFPDNIVREGRDVDGGRQRGSGSGPGIGEEGREEEQPENEEGEKNEADGTATRRRAHLDEQLLE